jgi:hypothetical protein
MKRISKEEIKKMCDNFIELKRKDVRAYLRSYEIAPLLEEIANKSRENVESLAKKFKFVDKGNRLLRIEEKYPKCWELRQVGIGLVKVPTEKIVGVCTRENEFNADWTPKAMKRNWLSIYAGVEEGLTLEYMGPGTGDYPITLYEINGEYFVATGIHRVSVAKVLGIPVIECEIIKLE